MSTDTDLWTQKGREAADRETPIRQQWWRSKPVEAVEAHLRVEFADLLLAAGWAAAVGGGVVYGYAKQKGTEANMDDASRCAVLAADHAQAVALRLLVEGFRARLAQIAAERTEAGQP